ncbi:hypothetical protein BCR44DRAFT_1500025 [Catenaria anguillulae PL171]|uniref:Cyclin-D1-binding protein 1-like N-terminal domain-containing protein n=1 Tax=Catenaria anguillulae PL171 TaxID=765915 RepID=A0A1Y2HKQ4_9FUNG|nr:hypothetical protein BCR44DRAFT_1500025 [Catenaria anguillulae PL171]
MVSKQQALAKKAKAKARVASNSSSASASPSAATTSRPPAPCVPVLIQLLNALSTNVSLLDSELLTPTLAVSAADFDADTYATQLHAVGAHIHHAITKFTLLHREEEVGSQGPPAETSKAEVKSLVTLSTQLVAHVASRPKSLDAPALVEGFVTNLSGGADAAAAALAAGTATSATDRALAKYLLDTGVAWKSADLIKELPLTNRAAVCKAWKAEADLAKDVLAEVKESVEEFEAGGGGENDFFSDEDDEGDDGDADGDEQEQQDAAGLSDEAKAAELARLAIVVKLVTLSSSFSAKVTSFLSTSTPDPSDMSPLDALPDTASALAESLDELGAAVAECPLPRSGEPGYAGLRMHMDRLLALWSRILCAGGNGKSEEQQELSWLVGESNAASKWVSEARMALVKAREVVDKEFGAVDSDGEE